MNCKDGTDKANDTAKDCGGSGVNSASPAVDPVKKAHWDQLQEEMRRAHDPDLIVSASSYPTSWIPELVEGSVAVTTADGKRHLVVKGSYPCDGNYKFSEHENNIFLLSDCIPFDNK